MDKKLTDYAETLGHTNIYLFQASKGLIAVCDCGYRSVTRRNQAEALRAAIYHLEESARTHLRELRKAGVSPL